MSGKIFIADTLNFDHDKIVSIDFVDSLDGSMTVLIKLKPEKDLKWRLLKMYVSERDN